MVITRLESGFKGLGKLYQLLAYENYYFAGGYHSQKAWVDYDKNIKRIKASIKKLQEHILY